LKLIKEKPSWVILNDFEQLSAFIWVPIFKVFLNKKHRFVVILHDPDRDAYPPSLSFTNFSMRQIISLVHVAIYHDFLPDKPYYQGFKNCIFLDLPHGFYPLPKPDAELFQKLSSLEEEGKVIMAILGNIRPEKNYNLAIEALAQLPNHYLIIAGSTANGRVNLQTYRDLAKKLNVENRLVWIEKFLTEAEMSAIIEITDVILLNYAVSFTSQSGILNVVAPFRKELIVSNGPSSLASIIRRFKVGELVEPGSTQSLVYGLKKLLAEEVELRQNWEEYLAYASWENHVSKAIMVFRKIKNN
jgi:glycosyltransferase involved in cell wall biosynthesis